MDRGVGTNRRQARGSGAVSAVTDPWPFDEDFDPLTPG